MSLNKNKHLHRSLQGSYTFFEQKFKDSVKETFFLFSKIQEEQNQANIMQHEMLKVESAMIFISDAYKALMDKMGNKF